MFPHQESSKPTIPTILRFLCYLTMFGSIYMVLTSISGLSNPEAVSQAMNKSIGEFQNFFQQSLGKDPASEEKFEEIMRDLSYANTAGNMRDNSFFILISNVLTLSGAWLMLRLRKKGFHLYFLGNIIGVIAPLLVFGSDNFLGLSYAWFTAITGGLFVILYALKIKYMH